MTHPSTTRFWSKVDKRGPVPVQRPELGPCWVWAAGFFDTGYGSFWVDGKDVGAHVFAYRITKGEIVPGYQIDHLCRNRACVNPGHLEQVTPRVNTLRSTALSAINAIKTHCVRGHEFTPGNTRIRNNGSRACNECQRVRRANNPEAKKLSDRKYRSKPEVVEYQKSYYQQHRTEIRAAQKAYRATKTTNNLER